MTLFAVCFVRFEEQFFSVGSVTINRDERGAIATSVLIPVLTTVLTHQRALLQTECCL